MFLVTGATGLAGRHLVALLRSEGHEVRALVRKGSDLRMLNGLDVEKVTGDLTDAESVRIAHRGVETVFHLGALVGDWGRARDFMRINYAGTENVLQACLKERVKRLLYVSSSSVLGNEDSPIKKDESFPYKPENFGLKFSDINAYTLSKYRAERLVLGADTVEGLRVTVIRPMSIYGPGEVHSGPFDLCQLMKKGMAVLPGDGSNLHHLLYASDLADVILRAAVHPEAAGKIYNIGGKEILPLGEICRAFAEALGVDPPRFVPAALLYPAAVCLELVYKAIRLCRPPVLTRFRIKALTATILFDNSLAEEHLGYRPKIGVREGAVQSVTWWLSEGLL